LDYLTFGLDFLGSYGRITAQRVIRFFHALAKNTHNLWNISYMGKWELHMLKKKVKFDLYQEFGQNFGKENPYLETNAIGINHFVWKEKIKVFRNVVGFKIYNTPTHIFSYFFDGAWVYDRYSNSKSFYAAFEGTSAFAKYSDFYPPRNLTRISAGIALHYKKIYLELSYLSLFGKRFSQNNGEIKIDLKL